MEIRIEGELFPYLNDLWEVARAFAPFLHITQEGVPLRAEVGERGGEFSICFTLNGEAFAQGKRSFAGESELVRKKFNKRLAKTVLYRALSERLGVKLPYGSLTGVRPTKLLYELYAEGKGIKELEEWFFVEPARAQLLADVIEGQRGVRDLDPKKVDIFVNVPFCPTRCKYCSFISTEIGRIRKQIPRYIECVNLELERIKEEIAREDLKLGAIYVGGGTPSALEAEDLYALLLPLAGVQAEFTVECGRPDSITAGKLDALKALGVNRISVNPQTFSDETLQRIGRTHTSEDVYAAFSLARKYPFRINMDLIAGLQGEGEREFSSSLSKAIALRPENLTVHTLSLKRGAEYRNEGAQKQADGAIKAMIDHGRERLKEAGYQPYYLYRQKSMADNLENVGYTLAGQACRYNVDYMEETTSVLSAGAGAMTKRVDLEKNRIERKANGKGLEDYFRAFS